MLKPLQLLEERDLPEDGHWHAVLCQREVHRLQGHDLAGLGVARPVHSSVGAWKFVRRFSYLIFAFSLYEFFS